MSDQKCKHCGAEVSEWAGACKQCRKYWPTNGLKQYTLPGVFIILLIALVLPFGSSDTSEASEGNSTKSYSEQIAQGTLADWHKGSDQEREDVARFYAWVLMGEPNSNRSDEINALTDSLVECLDATKVKGVSNEEKQAVMGVGVDESMVICNTLLGSG